MYAGEHTAIVDAEVLDRVRTRLSLNGRTGGSRIRNAQRATRNAEVAGQLLRRIDREEAEAP